MIKVLLVDDEPFILQGLSILLDWNSEGFEIVGSVSNGEEALAFLEKNEVELVVSDVQMPVINGIELLKRIREKYEDSIEVIILSGYKEFEYAREGMMYGCTGYVLKPVEKTEFVSLLRKIAQKKLKNADSLEKQRTMEKAYVARNVIALLAGKYDEVNVQNVRNNLRLSEEIRFVDIEFENAYFEVEEEEGELRTAQRELYERCVQILKEDAEHVIFDPSPNQNSYDVGIILCDYMYKRDDMEIEEYLQQLYENLTANMDRQVKILVGKSVNDIKRISTSYSNVLILKSFEGFRQQKNIFFYEDEVQVDKSGVVLCKDYIDNLIDSIEKNEQDNIRKNVNELFINIRRMGMNNKVVTLNIDYLLFQLIHIAIKQDDDVNQEEILHFISESSFEEGVMRGSVEHLTSFALQYSDYLTQLRKNMSGGVLNEIEKEVRQNYMTNLSLKDLSKKYFINSSYLGQVFRKKYGMSFKDYLTNYRINEACVMLISSDDRIIDIADKVGYKDSDYFIRKFIEIKGCTPSKYRKSKTN